MEQPKIYYGSKLKFIGLLISSIIFVSFSISLLQQPQENFSQIDQLWSWVSILFFSLGGIYCVYLLIKQKPSIVIDESGLTVLGFPTVRWEEISSAYIFKYYNQNFLGIRLKDKTSFINKLSPIRRFFANLSASDWPAVSIGQIMVKDSLEAVLPEIVSRIHIPPGRRTSSTLVRAPGPLESNSERTQGKLGFLRWLSSYLMQRPPVLKILLVFWWLLFFLLVYLSYKTYIHRQAALIPLGLLFITYVLDTIRSRDIVLFGRFYARPYAVGTAVWKVVTIFIAITGLGNTLIGINALLGSYSLTIVYVLSTAVIVAVVIIIMAIFRTQKDKY